MGDLARANNASAVNAVATSSSLPKNLVYNANATSETVIVKTKLMNWIRDRRCLPLTKIGSEIPNNIYKEIIETGL